MEDQTFKHQPRQPSLDSVSGRGLYLVQQISSAWGISTDGPAQVWFELRASRLTRYSASSFEPSQVGQVAEISVELSLMLAIAIIRSFASVRS